MKIMLSKQLTQMELTIFCKEFFGKKIYSHPVNKMACECEFGVRYLKKFVIDYHSPTFDKVFQKIREYVEYLNSLKATKAEKVATAAKVEAAKVEAAKVEAAEVKAAKAAEVEVAKAKATEILFVPVDNWESLWNKDDEVAKVAEATEVTEAAEVVEVAEVAKVVEAIEVAKDTDVTKAAVPSNGFKIKANGKTRTQQKNCEAKEKRKKKRSEANNGSACSDGT